MATPQENLERFKEIESRGLQDKLPPEKRARFDEAKRRGLLGAGPSASKVQALKPVDDSQSRGPLDRAAGVAESAAAVVSGLASSSVGGLAGTAAALNPFGEAGDGAAVSQWIQEAGTYQPRTETGQEYLQNVATAANTPLAGYAGLAELAAGNGLDQAVSTKDQAQQQGANKVLGGRVMDATGNPLLSTAAELSLDVAGLFLGGKGIQQARRSGDAIPNFRRAADQAGEVGVEIASQARRKINEIPDFPQSAKKQEITRRIQDGDLDQELAPYKTGELEVWERLTDKKPKAKKDKLAVEAINQGFDKGVIQSVKQASRSDKNKMAIMVAAKEKSLKNQEYGVSNRPSNIAGKSVGDMVREVERKRVYAGSELNKIAKSLKSESVDIKPTVDSFVKSLQEDGIKLVPDENGGMGVDFRGSVIEGERAAEIAITRIVKRMNNTDVPNAFDVHRLKQFIYNQVNYAKGKRGLNGGVEVKLKGLANSLDGILDGKFSSYKRVNEQYASARQAIDAIEGISDSKLGLDNAFKDNNYGTLIRRTMSNAVSKDRLMDALQQVQEVANSKGFDLLDPQNPGKFTGKTFNDNLLAQALFVDELDVMFKPAARTSFQGQISQAVSRAGEAGQSSAGLARETINLVGKGFDKARGINEKGAFTAIKALLKEP